MRGPLKPVRCLRFHSSIENGLDFQIRNLGAVSISKWDDAAFKASEIRFMFGNMPGRTSTSSAISDENRTRNGAVTVGTSVPVGG